LQPFPLGNFEKGDGDVGMMMPKSRYGTLLLACGINLLCFTLLRAILYVKSWDVVDPSFAGALRVFGLGFFYDTVFCVYFSLFFAVLLLLLPNRVWTSRAFGWLGQAAFFAFLYALGFMLVAEWFFWDEFGTRFNFIAVDYLVYGTEVTRNIYESYPVIRLLACIFAASVVVFLGLRKTLAELFRVRESFRSRLAAASGIGVAFIAAVALVGQSPRDAFVNNYARELASNGPYQLVGAFRNNTLDYDTFYARGDEEDLSRLAKLSVAKNPDEGERFDISRSIHAGGRERQLNVILISIESLSAEFMTRFGNKEGITPFMDGLAKESLFFSSLFATGTRTDRGLEAITLSIPPTPGRSLVKRPDNAHLYSLGYVFRQRGYDVAFLYGGRGFFDNMNAFFSGNGYRTVDQTDLEGAEITFQNAWGVADEDLYRRTLKEADAAHGSGKHFFYHVMTTSNHRPFTYPEGRIDIPSGTGRSGAVKYTDHALKKFLSTARERPWFDETVFVVVADHCAGSAGEVGLPIRKYHIPLFIYSPKQIEPREVAKTCSQIDIAPTLLALLGFDYESRFWGNDVLRDDFAERALIGNYQKLGLYKDEQLVILSPRKLIDVMERPLVQNRIAKATTEDPLSREAMAYYQGADYILRHRMNRWEYARPASHALTQASER